MGLSKLGQWLPACPGGMGVVQGEAGEDGRGHDNRTTLSGGGCSGPRYVKQGRTKDRRGCAEHSFGAEPPGSQATA